MAPPRAADNFGQRQPITTAIKTICLYYPPNTCLRELLQNADDAGATEIEYVLDAKTYADEPLLNEGLRDYQGPALLARNNSVFRDEDFRSLSSIGDSVKKQDPASTGKFGQGFNAVYHWTDGPWIYSRNWLLILDPHEWWSRETGQAGGPRWDVIKDHDSVEIQNHLKTFSEFGLDHRRALDHTIIRIPLRTAGQAAQSKIFQQKVEVQGIKQALEDFGREMSEGGLLFLKHIRKIIIRLDSNVVLQTEIIETSKEDTKKREQLPTNFKDLYASQSSRMTEDIFPIFELAIKYTERETSKVFRYAVQHAMLRTSGDEKMDIWACERKLFPWVAIAAPLQDHCRGEAAPGRLFTILRLPMPTNLPVHVHGLFCIAPDRGRLDFTRASNDLPTIWNSFMFTRCVTLAWVKLLTCRNNMSWRREMYKFWPKPNFIPIESVALWDQMDDSVIDRVINCNLEVWNASNRRCVDIDSGLFASKDDDAARYGSALAQYNVPAVFLEALLFRKVQDRAKLLSKEFKILKPKTIRRFLRWEKLPQVSDDVVSSVLEFCLLDAIKSQLEGSSRSELYDDLEGIQLWPTVGGTFSISNNTVDLLLPRNDSEMQLFAPSRASTTLNSSKLSPLVRKMLLRDIENLTVVMRFRGLGDLATDWPMMHSIALPDGPLPDCVHRVSHLDTTLANIWAWISERVKERQRMVPALLGDLWLVPLSDGRIRRYASSLGSIPVLVIEPHDPLFGFLSGATSQSAAVAPPLLDTGLLPAEAVGLFRSNKEIHRATNCTCVNEPDSFVNWLVAGKSMLSAASNQDKENLLSHLETITRDSKFMGDVSSTLTTQIRRLPIYRKIECHPPFKKLEYTRCSLDAPEHLYETPSRLPPLPVIPGASFFHPESAAEVSLVKRLKALENASVKDLLTRHLLPWTKTVPTAIDDPLCTAKQSLLDWLMKKCRPYSNAWQSDVFSHPLIPLSNQDGHRQYRCIAGMVDPSSDLAQLFDPEESLFPCPNFFANHKEALLAYGMVSKPSWLTPLERARYFSQRGGDIKDHNIKVEKLLKLPISADLSNSKANVKEIRGLKWLPGTSIDGVGTLLAPNECRGADESHLTDLVWGTTTLVVKANWSKLLGWNNNIEAEVLLRQLDGCLLKHDYEKVNKILLRIHLDDCFELLTKPCILGRSAEYFTPEKVLLPASSVSLHPLAPYLDEIDGNFARKHKHLLVALKVQREPSIQDLQNVQSALIETYDDQLDQAGVGVVISTLEIATHLQYDPTDLLVPDTTSRLRVLGEIVYGDPLRIGDTDFNFTHPRISVDLIRRLGIEDSLARAIRLNMDLDSDDEEDYTPKENLETKISDTLERYPIATTFNEFLANADDAKATKIIWILDECKGGAHASSSLLTTELKPFQGAALLVYNDGSFSKKDFSGFKDIGQGGKQEDSTSTGMFGMGALSMYHFTDVPMLVSADSFLVLDPQQQVLPIDYRRRRKRRVGTRMLISAVERVALDQMSPFVGLHGFDRGADQYDGTIFRFPLRTIGAKTNLKDTSPQVDLAAVKSLLEAYFATARTALLFLRNVETIEFHIRGQQEPQWTVSAKRAQRVDQIFHRIEISTSRIGSESQVYTWCVGLKSVKETPSGITRSGRSSRKSAECGVAACLNQSTKLSPEDQGDASMLESASSAVAVTQPTLQQNVFCRLPTGHESSLPISIHASFAVTGDRRSIALEDSAENSGWNQWLLKSCVSTLYVDILQYLAPRLGQKAFDFWPTGGLPTTLSGVLRKAFWDQLGAQDPARGNLLPLLAQDIPFDGKDYATGLELTQKTTNLTAARFDFLQKSTSETLRTLLLQTVPYLVRPPDRLRVYFKTAVPGYSTKELDQGYLGHTFKVEDNCRLLEAFVASHENEDDKRSVMALVLKTMIPETADQATPALIDGCRIIPRPHLESPLGTVIWDPQPGAIWNLLPTSIEQELFVFAVETMVNNQLFPIGNNRNPIEDLLKSNFNVRRIEIGDLGTLLASPLSPTTSAQQDDLAVWMPKFWQYLNPKLRTMANSGEYSGTPLGLSVDEMLSKAGLQDHTIYPILSDTQWRYITPRQFEAQPCVIKPQNKQHQKVCGQIQGLLVVDRNCVPLLLRDKEDSFEKEASFKRLLQAFKKLEKTTNISAKTFIGNSLNRESKDVMKELSLKYLSSGDYHSTPMDAVLRRLPIWPRSKPSITPPYNHVAAEDANFCGHEQMLMPWVKNLSAFVDSHLVKSRGYEFGKLGCELLTREQVWHRIKGDIPTDVRATESRTEYLNFIRYLADSGLKPSGKIAPNGGSILCEINTLYDHQDEIFWAAFREQKTTRFLHKDMQDKELRSFWLSLGLRARPSTRVMSHEHFLECALAINRRWDPAFTNPTYSEDAEMISAYLSYNRPDFRSWPNTVWGKITTIPLFSVRDVHVDEVMYRQARMRQIAQEKTHCTVQESCNLVHKRIMWSQSRFLKNPPGDFVYETLPRSGAPTAAQVLQHLNFLMAMTEDISQGDLPEYLRDVQACYEHLQANLEATKLIPGVREYSVWLNLDTTQVDLVIKDYLEFSKTPANRLCLNCPVDPLPVKVARKFLVPYEKLLVGLGCRTVVQPKSTAPPPSSDSREQCLAEAMSTMVTLRDQGLFVDIIFEAGGQKKPAHRLVLAAVSDYCKGHFAGHWGRLLEHQAIVHLQDISFLTLTQMVDFAYTGNIKWPELKDACDNEEIGANLGQLLDLLHGTDMWLLQRLHDMTETFLISPHNSAIYVRVDTVDDVKLRAESARAHRLVKHCEDFLDTNKELVVAIRDDRVP